MSDFKPVVIDRDREDDIRADARAQMFSALRSAFKHRSEEGLKAKTLAEALGKDPGYVSRVLRGSTSSIDYETMFLFLEALAFSVQIDAVPVEETSRTNFCARPQHANSGSVSVIESSIQYLHRASTKDSRHSYSTMIAGKFEIQHLSQEVRHPKTFATSAAVGV